jgi:restriction system protein
VLKRCHESRNQGGIHMKDAGTIIQPHGGYRSLKAYQTAEIIYDGTVKFCERFIDHRSRTRDQMIQASRSGKQNIAEGSQASGTSKKIELKLVGIARASLEELLLDYQDFLRQRQLPLWDKDHPLAKKIRNLAYQENRSYLTYKTYIEESSAEVAANTMICLVHQGNYLLDQMLRKLDRQFLEKGGFTERLYHSRQKARSSF